MTHKQTRNSIELLPQTSVSAAGPDAFSIQAPTPDPVKVEWFDTIDGGENPRWRQQIALGLGASTSLDVTAKDWIFSPGLFKYEANIYSDLDPAGNRCVISRGAFAGWPSPTTNASAVPTGDAENRAASLFYNRIRNRMSQFKGATFLAEAGEAKRMIKGRATSMLDLIPGYQSTLQRKWKRSKGKKAKLKTLSNLYLELQFGWRPLASDIEDAVKTLHNPVPQQVRVSSGPVNETTVEVDDLRTDDQGDWQKFVHELQVANYQIRFYGAVNARRQPEGSQLGDFGLATEEFLPTLWEVLPWSFAVDYFTNVSDIITAISYARADIAWTSKVECYSRTRTYSGTPMPSKFASRYEGFYRQVVGIPSVASVTAKRIIRYPGADVPIPSLTWELPSPEQALNLAALAVSRRLRLAF